MNFRRLGSICVGFQIFFTEFAEITEVTEKNGVLEFLSDE
jgi:hypothetical protein